jgi:predicted nucleotidyltransferase
MKLIAWDDRRFERDAQDLGFIMKHYFDAGNETRVIGDEAENADLLNSDFDYNLASARVLGRDVGKLLTEQSLKPVLKVLEEQTGDRTQYPLVNAMLANFHGEFENALAMLGSFRKGVLDTC